jgi:hypothetical protein
VKDQEWPIQGNMQGGIIMISFGRPEKILSYLTIDFSLSLRFYKVFAFSGVAKIRDLNLSLGFLSAIVFLRHMNFSITASANLYRTGMHHSDTPISFPIPKVTHEEARPTGFMVISFCRRYHHPIN